MGDILDQHQIPEGLCTSGVHKFRCQKPYEDKTLKIPNTGTADRLQSLRAIIKTTSSRKTLDPLKEWKEIKEGQVPLPPEVPDCRSNPLSRDPRPSALPPATRKRVASTSVHRPGKVQRSLDISTVFEEFMDFDHWSTRVSATSPRPCAGDASEKVNEDDTVPGLSSANSSTDQRGLVISPRFQGSLQFSSPTQGALGSSTSSQDAQGVSLSTQKVLGGTQCDQGSMGHFISSQASQKLPPCDERKIKNDSLSGRGFRSPSSSKGVINHSNSPPKRFRQAPSDQGGLHQAPLGKDSSKCFSPKGVLSDFSFSQNGICPTPSSQGSLTPLTSAKDGWRAIPSHEESQGYFPLPQNDPKQSIAAEVSLSPASSDQGNFITSPLKKEGFKYPPPENGLGSSLTAQGEPSPITTPQVSLIPLMPTQAKTKLSTSTSGIQEPLPSSERALESPTCLQEMLGTPKSTQGTLLSSQHTRRALTPASTSLRVLSPSISVKRTTELSTSREEGQRPILSHEEKFKPYPDMKMNTGYCHYSKKRRTDPPSEQGGFPVSVSYQESFKYTLPTKKALLIRHQKQNSQRYAKRVQVSHASSTTTQGAKTIQPSLFPQGSLGLSTYVGEALEISTYTPGLPGHLQPVQHFLGSTICDRGTVGQDTSAEEVPDSSQSLEMALGCDTCTQQFVANFTLKEGDSLDSTCPQTATGPLYSSQEAVEISPSPQGYQQSVITTQEAIGHSPSSQRDVSLSTCPQVTPEHLTNTPKVLNSTLSSQGPLEPVLSIQLSLEPNVSIQKALSFSSPEESIPETSTVTQGAPVTSLAAHEDFRPTTYAQETLGDTTPTQVLETSPHSEAVVKKHTCTPDTVAPSPSEQEALGSTISGEGTLQSSPSTQESFMHISSQKGNIKHPPSTQVYSGHSISTKKRLRDDPSDEGDFGTSSFEEGSFIFFHSSKRVYASSTALKETLITTSTPQVSPMPSISVQKTLQCSSSEQKTVEPCHSNQGPHGHSISSQEAQGPSLSVPKGLCHLPSVPGLQGHYPSLSKAPENSTYTQGDLSISKSDLGALKSSLSAKRSKGKAKCKQKHLGPLPLAQEDRTPPMSSKPSKDPYASFCLLAAEHFPSPPGSPVPSTSKQWYLGASLSCQGFLGHSPSAPGALCCFQAAQGAKELLSSAQGPQESFLPSLSYSEHLPNLPGDREDSLLEQGILEKVFPAQGSLETLCSPGVSLQRPLLSLQRPLDLLIPTQESAGTLPSTPKAPGSLLSLSSKVGTSQSAQGLQRFLPSTHEYLENSSSVFVPLEHLPVAPKTWGLSTLFQETSSPLLSIHGILELPQNGSVALPSMPYVQGLQGSLSSSEGSIAPVLSVQGSVGLSLSAQEPIEISKSTKATPGHSLLVLDDMSPFMSFQGTLGPLSSVEVDVGTYSHNTGSPGQLKNILEYMITDQDSVVISSPAQGTLRHLPSAQGDVGLPLFAQQAPELSTWEQGSIQHVEAAKVALVNPSSPKGATGHFQCAQYTLEHLPPSKGSLTYSSTHQGTQGSLKSSQEALEILSSNSEHVKNSLSVTGGLESSPPGPRVLGHMLADKQPEQLSLSTQGSLGNSLSTQEAQEHLTLSMGNLKPCQSTKEELKTLIPSQIILESAPSISEDLGALSSALEHMGLSSLVNESPENSQYAESVVESSSATGSLRPTLFAQRSLENSLPGKGIRETLSSSQGALEIFSPTKGRVENVSSPEKSMKPPTSLQEVSRPSPLIQGPHQHPLSSQGPLGPYQTDSVIQRPLLTPEAGGNLSRELGSWKSCPLTPETLDHLQSTERPDDLSISAHGMFDPLPSTQGTLGLSVYSPGLMELSESEHKKLGPVSYVGKDGEISPFEKPAKSTSPSTPYLPFITEFLESSSCGLGSLGSLSFSREDAKGTPSAPHAQEPSSSTSQALEHSVTTQGPLQINTLDEQTLCFLPSTVEDIEHSTFSPGFPIGSQILPNVLDHLSSIGESEEFSLSAPVTKDIPLLPPEPLEHSFLQNATQATPPCLQEVVGSLISEQGSLGWSPSAHGSLEPLASTLGAEGPSLSEADIIQLSASEPVTKANLTSSLGPSASKYYDQMKVPSLHGDLEASQSYQRILEMTKFAEGALENLSVAQRTTKLSTCSQEANKSSLSDQGNLLHLPRVKVALIPALSDQETEESLLSPSEDTQHPPSSVSAQIQEPSLSTPGPQEPLKLSISVCDSLCSFLSSLELETIELSTSSPECLELSQSAQGEPEYFSTVGKTIDHSSTASQTTRKLSSPQGCGGHLSSAPSVQELFQSGPVNLATLLSSQGPQKPFKLTQGLLHPSASAQESQGPSESSQDVVGTHESSNRIHEYFLPVETFTSVSGTKVTSPSAPQTLEISSLLHVTRATSLTDQRVVGPRPPSQRALEVLSLAEGTRKTLASSQGDGRNSQLEKDTVEQSFSVQGILGSLPCTTGVLRSTPYAHKLPEILTSTSKDYLSLKGFLVLPISANRTLENLQSDHELTKHSNSFQEASRHSLFIQDPLQDSPSASETLGPSSNQGIKKSLLSSPGAMKPSSSAPDTNKPLQTTLRNRPTRLYNQGHWENSMSLQGTLGSFSSRSASVECSASSSLILGSPASFQSKLEHLFCTDTSPSFQGPTEPLSFPSWTTGHLQHGTRSHESSLSASKDLAHFLSDQLYISTQGTVASSPYSQQSQQSASSQEMLGPSKFDQCTHSHMSSVPDNLGMSPFVPMITGTLPQTPMTPGLFSQTQTSPVPSPSLQKDDESCLSSQAILEVNTSGKDTLKPSPTTQVPEKASLYTKPTLVKPTGAQSTEGYQASKSGTNQSIQKELGVSPPAQRQLVISLSTQGTLGSCSSDQGALGTSQSVQGSLKLSTPAQGTVGTLAPSKRALQHPISSQESPKFSSSAQHTVQSSASFPRITGPFPSIQKPQGSFLSSLAHREHSPLAPGAQENPLSNPWTLEHLLSSKVPKELSTATEETLPVLSSLSSIQRPSKHSGVLRQYQYSQNTLQHLSCVREGVETSQSATRTIEALPPPLMARGHLTSIQGSEESFLSGQGNLEPLKAAQGPLKHVMSSQEMLHSAQFSEGTLQLSAPFQAVPEPYTNSPSTQVTRRTFPSVPGHLALLSSTQATPLSFCSDEKTVRTCPSSQGTLKMSKSAQGTLESSDSLVTGEFLLSAKGTMGNLTSVKQTVVPFTSMTGPLRSIQNTQVLLGSLQSGQSSMQVSQATEGLVDPSLFPEGSLELSVSAQGTPVTLMCNQGTRKHPASYQTSQKTSQSVKNSLQHPPSVPGFLNPSQSEKSKLGSLSSSPEFLGSSPPQQVCSGDSLSVQRTHGTLISAQEFVGHSKSDQESPEIFTSSQEDLGPSLAQEALVHSSSTPQDCGLSQSSKDTLVTPISTQGARKTPPSVQKSIVTVPSAQSVLGIQRPLGTSQFASETSEPSSEEFYSILKSIKSSVETMTSILEILRFSTSAKGAADDQVILRSPTVSHRALELSPSDQQSVKSASSQLGPDRTSLTDKGLQEMSLGEKVTLRDSPLQQICSGNALSTQGALGLSISAQESLGHSSSVHGSPDTSLSSEEASGTCLDQGPLGPSLSLSDLGYLGLSEYSQGPLETSPSPHHTLEIPSSTHGIIETSPSAQDSLGHLPPSVQILQQAPLMPETSEPLSSTEEACSIPDSSPGTSETFPPTPGSLEISFSSQSTMGPSVSEKEILGASVVFLEEFLGPFPPDQESLRPTPSASGTGSLSPSEQCCQEISSGVQGDSPSQQGYAGNSLHSQEALGLSTLAQESLGHSPSAQGSLDTSFSSQESLGPSLNHGPLRHSSSDPENLGISDSDQGTLETPPFTQSILEISFSNNGVTETSTTSQDSLEHLPPSVQTLQPSLTPETSEPLLTAKEVCKTSESVSGTLESFPSMLEALRHLNSDQCTLCPSVCDQGTLEPSTPLHDTLENSKTSLGVLEPIPSTQEGVGPFFSMEFLGLSICAHDDFIPIPSHDDCLRCSSYPNKSHRISNSTKKIARHAPFPEGNISYSLSELEALRSLTSANVRKDSSSTSPPLWSVPPPASSELNFRSRSPNKEDLRCSFSPRGDSRHSKLKKTKSRHASKESDLKSVPSEDKGLKLHHSSKKGGRASVSNKVGARLKTDPKESLTTTSAKGDCRSSRSDEECLRYSPSSQGIPRCSRSTKTKLEEASSNKADVHTSHTEHEGSLLLLLLPGQDSDIPLILKKSSKLPLNPKKASGHLQMETVPVGVSSLSHHPKTMMSDIMFLQRRTLNTLFMSKRDRSLPLVPERGAVLGFLYNGDSYIHQLKSRVLHHSLLSKEISDIPDLN
ncbi:mucin-17-like [Chionomys nivalis]|uniref:mucin-17-like n=1 Tax=Chionomys nivalis TaxID=269649 RepID=UPI0025948759|nr:mucin-17-like [Chionomys nivalis]